MASFTSPQHLEFLDNAFVNIQNMGFKTSKMDHIALQYWYNSFLGLSGSMEKDFLSESQPWKLVCVASVSVRFRSKERGTRVKDRAIKTENTLPRSLFAPKPNGNACYAGYKKVQRMKFVRKKRWTCNNYNNISGSRICIDTQVRQVINWFYFFWFEEILPVANLAFIFSWIVLLDYFMRKKGKVNEVENARITKFNFVYNWNHTKRAWVTNDRMFPNTPEVSQMVFSVLWKPVWLIWSCPKNYLFVPMS